MFLLQLHTELMVQSNMFTCTRSEVCALVLRATGKASAARAGVSPLLRAEVGLCLTAMTLSHNPRVLLLALLTHLL